MNATRIVGIVIFVLGIALLIVGVNASDSFADQFTKAFTGHFTDGTTWYILGGCALGLLGLLLTVFGRGTPRMA
ncbi:MAG TPA: DUF3185 family protein [Phycisphaerales bacterium]|nr:DUF3185 family protein [Phycisphaerales bacterium]